MDSVKLALRIFERVAAHGEVGLADLVRDLDAPKSTIQRGLVTLHEAGWLRPVDGGTRRRWAPSARLALLGRADDTLPALRRRALPILQALRDETGETIHMTVRDGDRMVLVERCDSPHVLRIVWPLGATSPLHVSSNGKAVLATLGEPEVEAYLRRRLKAWTAQTITDPQRLRAELSAIRGRGYAINDRELDVGVRSVAAAITAPGGVAQAALSISCPADRLPEGLVPDFGERVQAAAMAICNSMGDEVGDSPLSGKGSTRGKTSFAPH